MGDLSFIHVFQRSTVPDAPVLLLLHGTGGNEHALVPLAKELSPGAGILSPRGQVLERGVPRFFRRLAEGVFDVDDVRRRAGDLAAFIREAAGTYAFPLNSVIAVGFSNGANIAGATLLLHHDVLGGAVLLRAMVPLMPDPLPQIPRTPVLISNGTRDPLVSADETERLVALLRAGGADVALEWQTAGHDLTDGDITIAGDWIAERRWPARRSPTGAASA